MTTRYAQQPESPATVVAGEAAVVTPGDARLHVLNEVGTRVWALCEGEGRTLDELVAALCAEFAVDEATARAQTQAFVDEAVALGILRTD